MRNTTGGYEWTDVSYGDGERFKVLTTCRSMANAVWMHDPFQSPQTMVAGDRADVSGRMTLAEVRTAILWS